MDFETRWQWITFGVGNETDGSSINAKTNNPADINIQVTMMYRIKEEYLDEIYQSYPSRNYHKDLVVVAKVSILSLYECNPESAAGIFH